MLAACGEMSRDRNLVVDIRNTPQATVSQHRFEDLATQYAQGVVAATLLDIEVLAQVADTRGTLRRIASLLGLCRRNGQKVRCSIGFSRGLIVAKEKQLILDDRSADGTAELLPSVGGMNFPVTGLGAY